MARPGSLLDRTRRPRALAAALVLLGALGAAPATPAPELSPKRVLGLIRATFRSHRPPPPFVAYTIDREQNTQQGFHDYEGSYVEHVWTRSADRASLARRVYRGSYRGDPMFERPAFNEERDPGPPTADLFEPAPLRPRPISVVPTPEPTSTGSALEILARTSAIGEFDYAVDAMDIEGDEVHLKLSPLRDPQRNRLREIYADRKTYELHRLLATDLLFVSNKETYGVLFTITVGMLQGTPVVTDIHGVVGDGYDDDGKVVDYHFKDIRFPATLPDWYFDAKQWGAHMKEMPS